MFDGVPLRGGSEAAAAMPAELLGRQRIAVIGSGIAGLSAAWLLANRHDVTLFEAGRTPGGHSNTVDVVFGSKTVPVDTGFIVYNRRTYPNLVALFDHLGVGTEESDMSFSVSVDRGRIEYAGSRSPASIFAQRRNVVRPAFWSMLGDILRFYRETRGRGADAELAGMTLGQLLDRGRYGEAFRSYHLLPMAAAIWSGPVSAMLDFPALSFVRFCDNHGLLQVGDRPRWRTVTGGSRSYVRRMVAALDGNVRLGAAVEAVRRFPDRVEVRVGGAVHRFDQVVIGAHADQALRMLADAVPEERAVLGAFPYQANRAILHGDPALMPRRRSVWASWNYLTERGTDGSGPVSVTYWMNRLQNLDPAFPLFLSLNPLREPDPRLVHREFHYDHPLYDMRALAAQQSLPGLQGVRRTWFCGSYWGHGFHEDGLVAGMAVAERLGAPAPWRETPAAAQPVLDRAA